MVNLRTVIISDSNDTGGGTSRLNLRWKDVVYYECFISFKSDGVIDNDNLCTRLCNSRRKCDSLRATNEINT